MITSEEIKKRLWSGANELRGSMDASRYKDYMLGLMFYKFLSDKLLRTFEEWLGEEKLGDEDLLERYKKRREKSPETLDKSLRNALGYTVQPDYLYQQWVADINNGDFELENVTDSLHQFERSANLEKDGKERGDFKGLFSSSTIDFADTALGSNLNERSKNVQKLIMLFADLNMVDLQEGDILGDAYEYLIGQFAMESGKKAGEFYTPHQVSEVMARIVTSSSRLESIYDPTVGSGSLLLTVGKHLDEREERRLHYYGQEKNTATYNLARMNLILHGVRPENISLKNGDTLGQDWPDDPDNSNKGVQFDAVVMNPPYSVKGWNKHDLKISDPRFELGGVLPPDSKGDFAFLLHGLFHLGQEGTMAIVLPHGVLFRGGAEGEIRKRLLEKNYIDSIIGLPSNLFTNTGIPVVILILKKNRGLEDPLLVIDASEEFVKEGKQNILEERHIARIVDSYIERREEEGYSRLVYRKDLVENDYNMNIPRYVVRLEDEIAHDVDGHLLGAIPKRDIDSLEILNSLVAEILYGGLEEKEDGYYRLKKDIDQLEREILESREIGEKSDRMREDLRTYLDSYWTQLVGLGEEADLKELKKSMLEDIKRVLESFSFVNSYDGYQNISDIWDQGLQKDLELIKNLDFYSLGRKREPRMVTKGTGKNKREEQDGWIGSLVPNELVLDRLYRDEKTQLEDLRDRLEDLEGELEELVENAKLEGTEENEVLYDCLNKNKEGEPTNSFALGQVRKEKKLYSKDTEEYALVERLEDLLDTRNSTNKAIRTREEELKKKVEDRIPALEDREIEALVYEKWFGGLEEKMLDLVEDPIRNELDTLRQLSERYKDTLEDLDQEYRALEREFRSLEEELVKN